MEILGSILVCLVLLWFIVMVLSVLFILTLMMIGFAIEELKRFKLKRKVQRS